MFPYNASHNHPTTLLLDSMKAMIPPSLQPFLTLSYPIPPSASSHVSHLLNLHSEAQPHAHTHLHASSNTAIQRSPTLYDKGTQDIYFVAFCAIAFTLLREGLIRFGFRPFANWYLRSAATASRARRKGDAAGSGNGRVNGKGRKEGETKSERRRRNHTSLRFAEQGWSLTYCTTFWTLGMVNTLCPPLGQLASHAHR